MGGIANMVGGILQAVGAGQARARAAAPPPPPPAPVGGAGPAPTALFGGGGGGRSASDLNALSRSSGEPSSVPLPPPPPPPPSGPNGLQTAGNILQSLFGGNNSGGGSPFGNSSGGPPSGNNSGGFPGFGGFPNFGGGGRFDRMFEPVMLDLNEDGKLGVTGVSTAKDRIDKQVGRQVQFDMNGDGKKDTLEWMNGDGDGMLVDDRAGKVSAAEKGNGEITGKELFGDQDGSAHGFDKAKTMDANGDGKVSGQELEGIKVWVDDGDAKVEAGELKSLAELGITEIGTGMHHEQNQRGETLMRGSFVRNGQRKLAEDVWFAGKAG